MARPRQCPDWQTGNVADGSMLDAAVTTIRINSPQTIKATLYRALAAAELKAPVSAQGSFIPAGNAFDAFAALAKVARERQRRCPDRRSVHG